MNSLVLVLILLVVGFASLLLIRKARGRGRNGSTGGIPSGKEEQFAIGMAPGEDGVPVMYTLTTCRHCVHLRNFLVANNIAHHLIYVDEFTSKARGDMMQTLRKHNERGSFPTLVLPGGQTLVGFREGEVRAAFHLPNKLENQ